jgi:hypothetical protein
VRPVIQEGDRVAGRTVAAIHAGSALAAPAEHAAARDDHWLVLAEDTDDGPLVIRAVPLGSDLTGRARDLDDLHHH